MTTTEKPGVADWHDWPAWSEPEWYFVVKLMSKSWTGHNKPCSSIGWVIRVLGIRPPSAKGIWCCSIVWSDVLYVLDTLIGKDWGTRWESCQTDPENPKVGASKERWQVSLGQEGCSQVCHRSKHLSVGGVRRGHEEGLSAGLKEVLAHYQRVPEREAMLSTVCTEQARPTTNLDCRCSWAKSEDGEDLFISLAEVMAMT